MKIIRSLTAMTAWSDRLRRESVTIGFVPTMGALHDGHRSLIRAARLQCDALVVSIFVNPTQFGPTEDFARYPRSPKMDRALCLSEGVDACFEPSSVAMYPKGFQTLVTVPAMARRWEGESRPDHFPGVTTVVTKLFGIVRPHLALFGQKDFQQATLVQRLVQDLNMGVKIVVCPTIREQDGLAMSSRNVYLKTEERAVAGALYKSLLAGADAIRRGTTDASVILASMSAIIRREPAFTIDYLAVCDTLTLEPISLVTSKAVLLGAGRLGSIRLIDNLVVTAPAKRKR
ncbi:MAG: pantoate--beta-alanine ligase [Nitrospira sp.]|nr:pantoate--beta-alanine ligase [Nitrospira sp.]